MAPMSEKIAANRLMIIGRIDFIFNICWERINLKPARIWAASEPL
jgi:hypothetical protein